MTQIGDYPDGFYRVSLKAVIRNKDGDILMVKENADDWDLPGGGFDHDLSIEECFKKELAEEVGYDGKILDMKILGCAKKYLPSKNRFMFRVIYELKLENDDFSVGKDCHEIKFINPIVFKDSTNPFESAIYSCCK